MVGEDSSRQAWQIATQDPAANEQLARIWADVVAHDQNGLVKDLMDLPHLINRPEPDPGLEIGRFPTGKDLNQFRIVVSHVRNGQPTQILPTHSGYTATVYLAWHWLPPERGSPYDLLVRGLPQEGQEWKEKMMAVQLYHELLDVRINLEKKDQWPTKSRLVYPIYQDWSAWAYSDAAREKREDLQQQLRALNAVMPSRTKDLERLLQEKFAVQTAFEVFGVLASNEWIARSCIDGSFN
jgi:hypothetical protein